MKKKLFFCAMLLFGLAATDVHAQVFAELNTSSNTDRGIVREQNKSTCRIHYCHRHAIQTAALHHSRQTVLERHVVIPNPSMKAATLHII